MNCDKSELDNEKKQEILFLPKMIKEENASENQLKHSTKHYIEKSVTEFYIKSEEIEIKTEDADISDTEHYESMDGHHQNKSYKVKHNESRQRMKRTFSCKICCAAYSSKSVLAIHKLTVHGESLQTKLYKCEQCTFICRYKCYLARHKLSHKKNSETEVYECPRCPFKTKYKRNVQGHSLLHLRNNQMLTDNPKILIHSCSQCSYKTIDKRHMKYHDMTHKDKSELPTYNCFHCPYKAKRKTHLRRHMTQHQHPRLSTNNTAYQSIINTTH